MQKRFSSNLLTYWKNFTGFDSTTLSESNTRTRTFLNLDFSETRTDDKITLKTSESGSWYLSDLRRFVKHMGDLLLKVLRDNNETFEELFDWQEYERMSFLARRSEQGCIDFIETVWKKLDSLHKTEDKAEATIAKLKRYIEENLGGELTRSVLAGQVYLSEDYITRLFIRETGRTLPVYIARRRMEKAAKLLRESTDPISKIAMEVGYSNFSYFSKTFRDYVGSTPNEYRAKYRK